MVRLPLVPLFLQRLVVLVSYSCMHKGYGIKSNFSIFPYGASVPLVPLFLQRLAVLVSYSCLQKVYGITSNFSFFSVRNASIKTRQGSGSP